VNSPTVEILFAVQTHAQAGFDPSTTAFALVGAGLRHRLDRQALDLGAIAVATDARRTGVDHVTDAWHGQRGFSDVGGQYDATTGVRLKDTLLLGRREARVKRQNLGMPELRLAQHFGGIADLALAGQEHQHIAWALALAALEGRQFVQRGQNRLIDGQVLFNAVAVFVLLAGQRAIPDVHGEGTPGHFDHRRIVEMLGKALQVDGRGGDDDFQVRTTRQQGFQVTQQEVDVQAAFVGFVDDDRVVALKKAIMLGFGQQNTVGHQLDQGIAVALILETHLIADQCAERRADLLGNPAGHAASGDTARLGMTDQTVLTATDFQADLRQLGGLPGAGLAGNDQHLVLEQRLLDLVTLGRDGQVIVITNRRHTFTPRRDLRTGRLHPRYPLRQLRLVGLFAQVVQLTAQTMTFADHRLVEVFQKLVDRGRFVGHQARRVFFQMAGADCRRLWRVVTNGLSVRLSIAVMVCGSSAQSQ